jgi:hypothetical protein
MLYSKEIEDMLLLIVPAATCAPREAAPHGYLLHGNNQPRFKTIV